MFLIVFFIDFLFYVCLVFVSVIFLRLDFGFGVWILEFGFGFHSSLSRKAPQYIENQIMVPNKPNEKVPGLRCLVLMVVYGLSQTGILNGLCEYGRDFQPSCSKKLSKETSS